MKHKESRGRIGRKRRRNEKRVNEKEKEGTKDMRKKK
jgi:hypothetical protein